MLKSDKFEFKCGAAAKTKNDDRYNGKENRHHDPDGTAGSRKSPAFLSPVEILSKDSILLEIGTDVRTSRSAIRLSLDQRRRWAWMGRQLCLSPWPASHV